MPPLKSLLGPLLLLAAVLTAYTMWKSRPELVAADVDVSLPVVNVLTIEKRAIAVPIVASGTVTARQKLDLSTEVTGRVIWISPDFVAGVRVEAGTVLLKVDPLNYRVALADARAVLAGAELSLADARVQKQKASVKESQARVEAARQRIIQIQQDLANTEIRAPFNAIIDAQLVEYGQYLTVGKVVARLLGTDKAEIRLPITSIDRGYLNLQSSRQVLVQARLGAELSQWQGELVRIESRVDDQTRVFPAVVEVAFPYDLQRHPKPLSLGLFVSVEMQGIPVADAVKLPRTALHDGSKVFILQQGKLTQRAVTIAKELDDGIIVSDGLSDGDQVVTTRLPLMFAGLQVRDADG